MHASSPHYLERRGTKLMMPTKTDGQVKMSVAVRDQAFSVTSTSGSTPAIERAEASVLDSVKYDVAGMVNSRMKRMLVVLDMHGADIREIVGSRSNQINIHDGRSVMRETILAEMNRLGRDIQKLLDQYESGRP